MGSVLTTPIVYDFAAGTKNMMTDRHFIDARSANTHRRHCKPDLEERSELIWTSHLSSPGGKGQIKKPHPCGCGWLPRRAVPANVLSCCEKTNRRGLVTLRTRIVFDFPVVNLAMDESHEQSDSRRNAAFYAGARSRVKFDWLGTD